MNPSISSLIEDNGTLKFSIENINHSLINSLRRIIMSEIPSFVFHTFPYEENQCEIFINTTRFNNEILKQRLSCIPIHIKEEDFPYKEYIVEVNKRNDSEEIIFVTTEDFKIKNVATNKYLTEAEQKKVFPPDSITGDYIILARLRPQVAENIPGEQLHFSCRLSQKTCKHSSSYNVVSTCSYGNMLDAVRIDAIWKDKAQTYEKEKKTPDEIEFLKKDFMLLEAKRIYKPDCFNFTIESIGIYSNMELLYKGCTLLAEKCKQLIEDIKEKNISLKKSDNSTLDNEYILKMENEDYTLGNILNYVLFKKYYEDEKVLTFVGFQKPHPHIPESILRMALVEDADITTLQTIIMQSCEMLIKFYNDLRVNFKLE